MLKQSANSLLLVSTLSLAFLSLISDIVYRFNESRNESNLHLFYFDNFFYGWYYRLATAMHFAFAGLLMSPDEIISKRNLQIWRYGRIATHAIFFIECESLLQFTLTIYRATINDEALRGYFEDKAAPTRIFHFIGLNLARWTVSLFHIGQHVSAFEAIATDYIGGRQSQSINTRERLNRRIDCWLSRSVADYLVIRYLAYHALYPGDYYYYQYFYYYDDSNADTREQENMGNDHQRSFINAYDLDRYYRRLAIVWYAQIATNLTLIGTFAYAYMRLVRKEITLLNFVT